MRARWFVASLAIAAVATAEPRPTDKPKAIDVKPLLGKVDVFRDELGNYYVIPNQQMGNSDTETALFYGDGKTMYQQRVFGFSSDGTGARDWTMWAPRVKGMAGATLSLSNTGKADLSCNNRDKASRTLTALKADEAKGVLEHAKFFAPLWKRLSKFLARDDDGVYYFVDMLREEYGGNGYRVFAGPKGAMKELAMTNVVSDSAGEMYATKTGSLKIIAGTDGKAVWVKGGKKSELTVLDPQDNRYLIYRDLGIYGQLGTVCEDL